MSISLNQSYFIYDLLWMFIKSCGGQLDSPICRTAEEQVRTQNTRAERTEIMKAVYVGFALLVLVGSTSAQKFCTTGSLTTCNAAGVNFTCVGPSKDGCAKDVVNKKADLTLASADDMSKNGDDLKVVMGQKLKNLPKFVRYYGLAVVRKGTNFDFKGLKGQKSCHTGVGKTVGWKIPVGYLLYTKEMKWNTNQYQSAADFFGDSCAPGIKDKETTDAVKNDFCKLCNSTCRSDDGFAGYEGAFKCMAEGNKDRVGFVKQDTAETVFNKTGNKYGNKTDYELLCTNGSKKGLDDFEKCNINPRPAAALVTNKDASDATIKQYQDLLKAAGVAELKKGGFVSSNCEALKEFTGTAKEYVGRYGDYYNALSGPEDTGAASYTVVSLALHFAAIFALLLLI